MPLFVLKNHEYFLKVIYHLQYTTQAPFGLVFSELLSAAADSCKDWLNVCVNSGQEIPIILYCINLADSGTGKSRVEHAVTQPVREVESELESIYFKQLQEFKSNMRVWGVTEKAAEKALNKAIAKDEDTSKHEERLRRLQDEKPLPPRKMTLIVNDVTMAAIQQCYPSFSIRSDDAAHLLKKDFLADPSMMCSIWSGQPITIARGNKEDVKLLEARIGMSIMMQPTIFVTHYNKNKDKLIASGLLPRCLMYNASNTKMEHNLTDRSAFNEEAMEWFNNTIKMYLMNGVNRRMNGEKFKVLKLSEEALSTWSNMSAIVQQSIGPDGEVECYREHALRFMENATRIASVLEMLSDEPGDEISNDSMVAGIKFSNWFFDHYIELAGDGHKADTSHTDLMITWFEKNLFDKGLISIEKTSLRQRAPNQLRDIVLLNDVLRQLELIGMVRLFKSERKQFVEFVPSRVVYGHSKLNNLLTGGTLFRRPYFAPNGKLYSKKS